ncbi:transmembrane protein, putative (macronuclear) [Tetrahymena thermophila SB210]|uniref:Transmembrane protein, putative n=1 Tax=Tetrahymena thermophila (strain SB210) TaxID=312017 RepID=W7WZ22_TETTS|nr:transmembrane protein, putative [Tetrahymena thermophila SB210]EWS72160.1 transmembrane protein, putative [Tetrahymena thermophila SB210]|eukprot:XP_012655291.1 transmembrane protein, putative [Tetrahymena thermophila SB210]
MVLSILTIILILIQSQYSDGQKCPQTNIQTIVGFYGYYVFNNYLKLPKTNILIAISVQYSGTQIAHTTLYLDDISTTQDNVLDIVKTEYQILQLDYIEPFKKIIASNQSQILIIDPYSVKPIKQIDFSQVIGMTYIKDFGLIFMCGGVCECFVVEINYFQVIFRFNNCQYDSNPFITYTFSKAYKQNNGVVVLVVQDPKGLCTWSFQYSTADGFLNSSHNYDSHDQYDIIFLAGNNGLVLDFQVITTPNTNQVQSLNFLNLQNPFQVQLVGKQIYYAFMYHMVENQQLIIPVQDFYDNQKSFTFAYNYNTNTGQIRLYYKTNGFTKQYRIQLQQNYYFVSMFDNLIIITQDSIQGKIIQQFNIINSPYVGNSFISVYNNPLCYIIIQVGNYIKLYKTSLDNQNTFGHYLGLDYLALNVPSEQYKPVAFYQKNNNQDQVWVVLSLPIKKNNQNFLFHIIDMWNFQFQVLVSNNPDDNINKTSFALYCDQSQEIIGLDVLGNVYVWDAKNFTNFKYKATMTQYTCLNPQTGTLRYDINGIYLIVQCGDYQIISFNILSGQTQKIIKLSSLSDVFSFIEEIQLLLTYDFSSGNISIFQFQSGTIDSPFQTSSSLITAFYNAKKYQQIFTEVKSINLNINIDPSNIFNLIQEFISLDFGSNISLNIKNLNSSQKGQINITNYIQFSNYNSVTLDNVLLNFNTQTSAISSQQNCGIYLTNVQNSLLNNLDYKSQNSSINCFQIQINNSTTTISNTVLAHKDFSNVNQLITIANSNQIYFRNFQLLNSILNSQLTILNQISDTKLFIDNMIIQNNNCSSYYVNPPDLVGQLFQVGQSQVTNLLIANNSFCNQKIFSTNGNINQKNLEFIFQNITIQQNQFYIQAQYLFFDSIYYFNSVPQHSLLVSNVFSSENSYFSQNQGQQTVIETTSLFFTNQIKNITLQNVTVYNQYEISFCIVQFSNFVNLYNLTYQNDKEFQDRKNNIKFGGFIQLSEIQQLNLKLMKVSSIKAIDNSIMSITTQQYSKINMLFQNVEIFNSQFYQTKSNSPANPIYILSQQYSNITICQCSFHDNQLTGLINSQIQSTTALQIVSPLGDTSILETQFTNSKSNSIYNFVYLQSNQIFINQCNFKNSSFDLQDPISQFKQEGGSIRAKFNNLTIKGTQFVNSTANQGTFMYLESLSNNLNIQLNQTSFVQGYSDFQGSVLYIDNSNSDLFFKCSQCNFTDIYSFSKDSEAISIKYTDNQISSQKNTIQFLQAYLINILGQQNSFFINSANSITQFQNIQQTQTQNFSFPQQFTNQISNLQSQALVQCQYSNITISKSVFSNLYSLPNSISPLFINSTFSNINMTDIVFQQSKFSKSLINFGLGQIIIQKSQFLNNTQVYQSRFLQTLKSNLPYQNNSLIMIENSQLQATDNTLFENIQCYQNCYGSSIYMINSTFQIDQTKFINSKAVGGGAIFIESLRSSDNQITNSYFMSNQAMQDGGALYIHGNKGDQFQLKIALTVFNDNLSQQGSGGAIFINSDSNNSTQQSIFIKKSIMQNNQAQIGGAIQNFGINPFYDSNTIQNNKASLYGSNTFSYPTSLFLTNEIQFNQQYNQNIKQIVLNDFKSGGNLPNFIFQLRDDMNITVIQQKDQLLTSKIQVSSRTQNSTQYYIRGNSEISIDPTQHNFNFSNLQLIGIPESSAVIQFTSDSIKIYNPITSQYDSNYTFDVFVNFRSCSIGEIINKYNNFQECQACENGKYSLDYTSCYPCPNGGECQNGVIQLVQGFWREEQNSSDIIECTNRKENCIEKTFGNYVCTTGNIGPLCEECDIYGQFWGESFTRINKYQCTQCQDSQQNLWKLFLNYFFCKFFQFSNQIRFARNYFNYWSSNIKFSGLF